MHATELANLCGMTETSPGSTQTGPDDSIEKRVETVGRPLAHAEIKIIDPESGAIVPPAARPASNVPAATSSCLVTGRPGCHGEGD